MICSREGIFNSQNFWVKNLVHKCKDCDADNVCEYDSSNVARFAYCLLVMGSFWITECIPISVTALLPYILFPLFGLGRFSIDEMSLFHAKLFENHCQFLQEQWLLIIWRIQTSFYWVVWLLRLRLKHLICTGNRNKSKTVLGGLKLVGTWTCGTAQFSLVIN